MKSFFQPRPSPDAAETAELRSMMAAVQRSQAVIEFELDGTIISANPNFLAVIGYELAEVKGRHHRMLMDPAEAASPGPYPRLLKADKASACAAGLPIAAAVGASGFAAAIGSTTASGSDG